MSTRLATTVFVLAAVIVQACSPGKSPTSNIATGRNTNQTKTSATAAQCDPNYSGCVPIASDVDCAGGSGNGPAYVKGPVKVIGKDIYRLDSDRDGIGCE
ncbi:MAG TPA: hypothetical protein VJM50_13485 [Pyrinomonadaceae bacterium]|nr:hypothetical protein [Pyrinomonadaceae bacterium]